MTAAREWRVALLRGVDVGRAKRVALADPRALVERLGCGDVRTLLNGGNVAFTVPHGTAAHAGALTNERRRGRSLFRRPSLRAG